MSQIGLIAAGKPYQILTLSLIGGNTVNTEEVDKVLRVDLVCHFSIDLSVDVLVVELSSFKELRPEVLELYEKGNTSSWE